MDNKILNGQLDLFDNLKFVIFKDDNTYLHESFTIGSVHPYIFEHQNNFIIKIGDVYYGPLKKYCEIYK